RSREHYIPLYRSIHTDEWYAKALADPTNTKRCHVCKKHKHVSEFIKNRTQSSGFRGECKSCQMAAKRQKPKGLKEATKWDVWERDDFRCKWCGTRRYLAVDHIIPRSKGGTDRLSNLQTLCRSCNCSKQHLK